MYDFIKDISILEKVFKLKIYCDVIGFTIFLTNENYY